MADEIDVGPAQAVARRALCLAALCYRARVETAMVQRNARYEGSDADFSRRFQPVANKVKDWLKSEQLWDASPAAERRLLGARLGHMGPQEVINATWRAEALVVLLWALRLAESIPPYDTKTDLDAAFDSIGLLEETGTFVVNARLRGSCELCRARDTAELWHWRARTYQIQGEPDRHSSRFGKSKEEIVRVVATKAQDDDIFVAIDGDFPAFGEAYRKATVEEWRLLQSIAVERHHGLNWLCNMDEDWDSVTRDT